MTLSRQFLPDTTYFITRRTTQREFWLERAPQTTQIFLYCIAVAAQKTGVQLHGACVMSNHWHAVVSDPDMKIAKFYGWVHKYVAKAINCARGRCENLWSSEKTNVIPLESPEDVLDKIAYCLCNPVSAHLIADTRNWKGVWLYRKAHSRTILRPDVYFQTDGTMPEEAELQIWQPQFHGALSREEYENRIAAEVSLREQKIVDEMRSGNLSFMGMDAVLKQSHKDKPKSIEKPRGMNPRFAALDKWLRVSAIKRYKQFVLDYWEALKKWKLGNREVLFPAGTYALRIHLNVNVAPG